jgi:hypothetical protein
MKTKSQFLLSLFLLLTCTMNAQVQWYQSQDGNLQPNGTYAAGIRSLTRQSFVAAYMWRMENENYTWKISKSHINGTEQRSFFITAPYGIVEMKTGNRNSVYVLVRSFPFAQDPQYTVYKLDSNLVIKAQRSISFPNSYTIFNLNVFELDESGNLYLAGDGQYPSGPGYSPASFVMKTDKNLVTRWSRMDSVQTSYSRLHIERNGTVRLIEDFYTFYPDIKIQKISASGQLLQTRVYQTDAGRQSLTSLMDNDDNLLICGSKDGGGAQSVYLKKIARQSGLVVYSKNYFPAAGVNLDDAKLDDDGNLYVLLSQFLTSGSQCRLGKIQPRNGFLQWSQAFPFAQDSCFLRSIVPGEDDHLYVIGERKSGSFFTKGFAVKLKKYGHRTENYISPDSTSFAKSHTLLQGILSSENNLIAIGNTSDLDTLTGGSTYFRSFAMGMGKRRHGHDCGDDDRSAAVTETISAKAALPETTDLKAQVFPNPAQDRITVQNPDPANYSQVLIYDMRGQVQSAQQSNGSTASFDLSRFSSGFYLLVLRSPYGLADKTIRFAVKR